jgi:2-polyprenyl-6-methoxyphenol hydroxylase-like FAD-dependent oxidoreductase
VRRAIGASFDGAYYEGEYAMADGPDTTTFGEAAAVFLTSEGFVESFPLPNGRRRWVVRRSTETGSAPSREEIQRIVSSRTRVVLDASELDAPSAFRAERRIASSFTAGRIALVGDAAHVVSPIGGQGMNLGWLGARSVAEVLTSALRRGDDPSAALAADGRRRCAQASVAARRAEMNMWLGRPMQRTRPRELLVATLLALPTAHLLARAFTMRALEWGI